MDITEFMENNHRKLMHNLNLAIVGFAVERVPYEKSSVKLRLGVNFPGSFTPDNSILVVVIGKDGISSNELFRVTESEEKVFCLNGLLTEYEFIPMNTSKQLLIIDKKIFSGIEKLVGRGEGTDDNEIFRK